MAEVTSKGGGVVEFDFRTDPPLQQFQFRVDRFAKGISDWTVPLTACGKLFQRQMAMQFETEGRATGTAWERNEPAYAEWKATHGIRSHKVGVLTGALRSAMTGGGGYSERITRDHGDYGMSDSSAALPYGKKFSEKRPVLRMPARWGGEYQKLMQKWLVAEERGSMGIGGAGLGEAVRLGEFLGGGRVDWSQR